MAVSHVNTSFASEAHRLHYEDQVAHYAKNGKGLIFCLPTTSPYGDFATLPEHTWSPATKKHWENHNSLLTKISDLPKSTKLVSYTYHVAQLRSATGDVHITKADFERLEATPEATAILWKESHDHVLLMPKPALCFSEAQKKAYRDGSIQDRNAPCLGQCLAVGYRPQDMSMGADGRPVLPGGGRMKLVSVGELIRSLDGS